MTRWFFAASTLVLLAVAGASAAKPKFVSTWKAPGAVGGAYAGKKTVGLIVANDMQLRISAEEALARALTAKGLQGVAAYTVIPREDTRNPESARGFVERAGAAAVVILRLVDLTKETTPSSVMWTSAMPYGSLWSYYPYAWGATYEIIPGSTDIKLVVEMLVFDVAANRLVWGGTSETTNPKEAQAYVESLVESAAEQMRKDGLVKKK